jgi:hypothetical protein
MKVSIYKTSRALASATLVFALALTPLSGVPIASAVVGTQTWSGSAGDGKFSTAANWVENEVPEAGDALVFNTIPQPRNGETGQTLNNDIDVPFSSVTTSLANGTNPNYLYYVLSNTLRLQNNATWTTSENLSLIVNGGVRAAGNLMINSFSIEAVDMTATGVITLGSGTVIYGFPSAAGLVIKNGASVRCVTTATDSTIPYPITLGGGSGAAPVIKMGGCGGSPNPTGKKLTLNNVTLISSAQIGVPSPHIVEVKSLTKNGHSLTRTADATGKLVTPEGAQENKDKITKLDGDKPNEEASVEAKETAILNGSRGVIQVRDGGVIKGSGSVSELRIWTGGVVAPGNSPGKITIKDMLVLHASSVFEAELLNKDAYDQLVVQSTGTVNITDAKLDLKFLPGGDVNQGETFIIIDNQSSTPIQGTFAGLPEGTKITVGNAVFAISYVGGTGNDVVLTALVTAKAPGAPNSGFLALVQANPIISVVAGIAALGALFFASRSTFATATRKK